MKRDSMQFRERFLRWKQGEKVYDGGRPVDLEEYTEGKDSKKRKTVYRSLSGKVYNTREEAAKDNKYQIDPVYRMEQKAYNMPTYKLYDIPFIEDKSVTLTNAGLATGARLSTNLLDTLAVHAEKNNLPIKTALGIATKESTLGNPTDDSTFYKLFKDPVERKYYKNLHEKLGTLQHINKGEAIEPYFLINMFESPNPYFDALRWSSRGAKTEKQFIQNLKNGEAYADKQARKLIESGHFDQNVLDAAFSKYRKNPYSYNPGQGNYVQLVDQRADEVWGSPEIQAWYKDYLNRKNAGKFKDGKDSIYIKPSKRGSFTAAAKRRGMTVSQLESAVLNNPSNYSEAMRKKAQFSRNARKWNR